MGERTVLQQPRISRKPGRLLVAALVALVLVWIMARIRFTDDAPPQVAGQPLLGPLASRAALADLALEVARIETRVQPSLYVADIEMGAKQMPRRIVALRVSDTEAIALLPFDRSDSSRDVGVIKADPASGLVLLQSAGSPGSVSLAPRTPQRQQDSRFLLATSATADDVGLRPVFIPALQPVTRPAWSSPIWKPPSGTELEPGSFVFTPNGDFAGLVIDDADGPAIVRGDVLTAEIDRLRKRPTSAPGQLGIDVQPLTPAVAHATGSAGGVVVTWVDRHGAAAGLLIAGDVIEEVNGERLTADSWAVRARRIAAGEQVTLRVRRGEMREVAVIAGASNPPGVEGLGLTIRALPGIGSEVVHLVPFAAAHRSGLEPGDVITLAGDTQAPTPAQVRAAYGAQREGRGVLLALVRGNTHRIVVLEP